MSPRGENTRFQKEPGASPRRAQHPGSPEAELTSIKLARPNRQWTAALLAAGLLGCAACGGRENPGSTSPAGAASVPLSPAGEAAPGTPPSGRVPGARAAAPGGVGSAPGIPPLPVAVTATQVVARVNGEPIDGRHLI